MNKTKTNIVIKTYIQNIANQVKTIYEYTKEENIKYTNKQKIKYMSRNMFIHKDKVDFINEINSLKQKSILSEDSYSHLRDLIMKLSGESNLLDTPKQKIIELEIANRKILDWQKWKFELRKKDLKERTRLKISNLFENYDNYMWEWKLATFSELRNLWIALEKRI